MGTRVLSSATGADGAGAGAALVSGALVAGCRRGPPSPRFKTKRVAPPSAAPATAEKSKTPPQRRRGRTGTGVVVASANAVRRWRVGLVTSRVPLSASTNALTVVERSSGFFASAFSMAK